MLSYNESTVSSDDYPNGWNFERKPYPGRLLNKPPSRPSSASCLPTDYKRESPTIVENDDRSSSETNLLLQTSIEPIQNYNSTSSQSTTEKDSDEDTAYLPPLEYKMGKFLSISDTMLPAEERIHEYIAKGPAPSANKDKVADKAVKELDVAGAPVEENNGGKGETQEDDGGKEEKLTDDKMPTNYQPGKFVPTKSDTTSQPKDTKDATADDQDLEESSPPAIVEVPLGKFVAQNSTTSQLEEVSDTVTTADLGKPIPPTITDLEDEKLAKVVPPDETNKQSNKAKDKVQPSNRWFDAYMKCKAAQAKAAPVKKRMHPVIKEVPVKKLEKKEELPAKEPPVNASEVNMDDFEKVIKITPSKSQKWREAIQKYKTLEQKSVGQNVQAISEEQSQSSTVKSPQKSAEEPTYSSLAQRAQVFGGMRKKPLLRRAKSFQIGSSDNASSPLATGLTRPTRVLKRQMTASSFN